MLMVLVLVLVLVVLEFCEFQSSLLSSPVGKVAVESGFECGSTVVVLSSNSKLSSESSLLIVSISVSISVESSSVSEIERPSNSGLGTRHAAIPRTIEMATAIRDKFNNFNCRRKLRGDVLPWRVCVATNDVVDLK